MTTKALHITRILNAPRETVWEAWTTPEKIKHWWGPNDFTCPVAKVDLKVGGTYLFCMRSKGTIPQFPEGTDFWSTGTYTEIVPSEKIVASDHFADKDGNPISPKEAGMPGDWDEEMLVTTMFEDAGEGMTKISIEHLGHPEEMANDASAGWNQQLDKLEEFLK